MNGHAIAQVQPLAAIRDIGLIRLLSGAGGALRQTDCHFRTGLEAWLAATVLFAAAQFLMVAAG
jgi:hypothetical protein